MTLHRENKEQLPDSAKTVEDIILSQSHRGMDKLDGGSLRPRCREAAVALLAVDRGRLFLYTGFCAGGCGETDGPVGTFFLYRALQRLGWAPLILTDSCCRGFFPGCETLLVDCGSDSDDELRAILVREQPVAHLAVERLGQDRNRRYLNCRGDDIAAVTPRLDQLFAMAQSAGIPTFAIGDGGNEVGMGNFADFTERLGISPCVICCDYPIIASVSNWGAYGLLAELERLTGTALLPQFAEVESCLRHIVRCGATDGITLKNEMSVDGRAYLVDATILKELRAVIQPESS